MARTAPFKDRLEEQQAPGQEVRPTQQYLCGRGTRTLSGLSLLNELSRASSPGTFKNNQ